MLVYNVYIIVYGSGHNEHKKKSGLADNPEYCGGARGRKGA
jgi:hypothetical protein